MSWDGDLAFTCNTYLRHTLHLVLHQIRYYINNVYTNNSKYQNKRLISSSLGQRSSQTLRKHFLHLSMLDSYMIQEALLFSKVGSAGLALIDGVMIQVLSAWLADVGFFCD